MSVGVGSSDVGIRGKPCFFFAVIEGLGPTDVFEDGDFHRLASKVREARRTDAMLSMIPDRLIDEDAWIRGVQALPAARLSGGLPEVPFVEWMAASAGPSAEMEWFVEGCGRHGPPADLSGCKDAWALVYGTFGDSTVGVGVEIKVGTCKKGPLGAPVVTRSWVHDKRPGHIHIEDVSLNELAATLTLIRQH